METIPPSRATGKGKNPPRRFSSLLSAETTGRSFAGFAPLAASLAEISTNSATAPSFANIITWTGNGLALTAFLFLFAILNRSAQPAARQPAKNQRRTRQ